MAFNVSRIYRLLIFLVFIGIMLAGRLFYLQIVEGTELTLLSLSARVQEVPMEVARGEIVDRNGIPLTNNAQHFSLIVFPGQLEDVEVSSYELARITGLHSDTIAGKISKDERPFKLKTDLDALTAQKINTLKLPGVLIVPEKIRYGYSALAAHVTGYINTSDNRGVSGIEGMFDDFLRGNQPEYAAAMVDAAQQIIPGLGYKRLRLDNGSGPSNVVLTIDSKVQKIVEAVLDRHMQKGAVVVMKPSTGEILAMASRPNFDANNLNDYLVQESSPLLNRAISAYQPGSVFKLVVAAAALESKLVHPNDEFYDPGYIDVNGIRFKGWDYDRGPRGRITFTDAMAYSSNPVFIEVGQKIGAERLISFAQKLGFGQKTKLEFYGEADGNLPSHDNIYPGELANLAIGQGEFEATPVQMASLVSTIVNDGIKVEPYIVSKLTNSSGVVVKNYNASRGVRVLSKQTSAQMRDMMAAVTKYGTGQAAYVDGAGSAGKTGSAETGRTNSEGKGINHAWFAGYGPIDRPQYVIVVFIEDGMSGGDVAAPIFQEILSEINSVQAK
ncbi:peptidoglycan D,D-transpeptidase FtsI family protein [Dendrosporobacter sp. 1207_IL3150]|uniref:peptidoglycan D,D-transpeptidase FtsI family protein n=1 Tax=Dendrosporobacter sp. 1207_IL3150 TaxID=3084054 RepID=UPI002FD8D144